MSRRWWIGAAVLAAASAAAAYFLDPENGRARRVRFVERSGHVARVTEHRARRQARYVEHTLRGRLRHLTAGDRPRYAEDRTLLDRVESELFANRSIPHGKITFEVEGTTVILRGELASSEEMRRIEAAVRDVPGVDAVTSLFHMPGTPAPNKAEALAASAKVEKNGGRKK
ncbi:MAG TPA: BON domain-containing protein [Candidatus Dormibacteraeota bacterium]|nr:BON domain-containing protein [Candidatus Dormibacteraeota bacterium]